METPHRRNRNLHLQNVQQLSTPLRVPASPFLKNLGYGTGVNVYRLDRSPKNGQVRSPWAVKRVSQKLEKVEQKELFNTRIQEEAQILRKLQHPNIVGFRGVTKSANGVDTLVLECCNTSLGTILEERYELEQGPLPAQQIRKMIADISLALDYLHTEAKLLHGDLKSYNVLVKGKFDICKLCDFGVSLPLDEQGLIDFGKNPKLRYVGTNLWSAPEIMDEREVIDCKADIFSFGLIIYETIALVPPHTLSLNTDTEQQKTTLDSSLTDTGSEKSIVPDFEETENACGTRPPLPQAFQLCTEYNCIVEIFYCCTNELPEDRPMAKVIWQSLEKKMEDDKKTENENNDKN